MDRDDLALARQYDERHGVSPSLAAPLQAALDAAPGERLLDAGCGTGGYTRAFADQGLRVTGCDVSAVMLAGARQRLPEAALLQADARWLPLDDACADRLLCVNVLEHIDGWELALEEFGRVLVDGRLVIGVQTQQNHEGNWAAYYFPDAARREAARYPDERDLQRALKLLGFSRVHSGKVSYTDMDDGSLAAMKHWPAAFLDPHIRRTQPFFGRMDPDELEEGLQQLEADYQSGTLWHLIEHFRPWSRRYGDITLLSADSP
jgi:ubiquinone/menaquinone biosynthesis C-methylase UbiE